jgi:hypothetical protein
LAYFTALSFCQLARVPSSLDRLHLRESFGNLSVAWEQIPSTPAERRSEKAVKDESGLTADDWLAEG